MHFVLNKKRTTNKKRAKNKFQKYRAFKSNETTYGGFFFSLQFFLKKIVAVNECQLAMNVSMIQHIHKKACCTLTLEEPIIIFFFFFLNKRVQSFRLIVAGILVYPSVCMYARICISKQLFSVSSVRMFLKFSILLCNYIQENVTEFDFKKYQVTRNGSLLPHFDATSVFYTMLGQYE